MGWDVTNGLPRISLRGLFVASAVEAVFSARALYHFSIQMLVEILSPVFPKAPFFC